MAHGFFNRTHVDPPSFFSAFVDQVQGYIDIEYVALGHTLARSSALRAQLATPTAGESRKQNAGTAYRRLSQFLAVSGGALRLLRAYRPVERGFLTTARCSVLRPRGSGAMFGHTSTRVFPGPEDYLATKSP